MDKITEQDLANRGVKGLPDVPGLTTEEMQRKLEEIAREILIPKVNELVEGLNNANSNLSVIGSLYNGDTSEIAFESGNHVHEIGSITLPKGTYIIYFGGYNPISNRGTEWADTLTIKSHDGNEYASVSLGINVYVFNGMAIVSHDSVARYSFVLSSWESKAFTTAKNWSIKAVRVK